MQARIEQPAMVVPGAMKALYGLSKAIRETELPAATRTLVEIRASQINGCAFCLEMHHQEAREAGESDERIFTIAGWRDSPHFTDSERTALALTEAVTRLGDRSDPVPDAVWEEAARHHDEEQLAALVLQIASINVWNRLNVATRQVAGSIAV